MGLLWVGVQGVLYQVSVVDRRLGVELESTFSLSRWAWEGRKLGCSVLWHRVVAEVRAWW